MTSFFSKLLFSLNRISTKNFNRFLIELKELTTKTFKCKETKRADIPENKKKMRNLNY